MKILLMDQIAKVNYKYSFSLANAIQDCGNEVVLTIDKKEEVENCRCKRFNFFNTDEKNIGKLSKLFNYINSYRKIYREIKNGKYDILHTQWLIFSPVDYYYLRKIVKKTGVKLVVTIHDILPFNQKFYDFYFHKKVYKLANQIIVQAENNVKRFEELFPDLKKKMFLSGHGHFLDYATPIDKKEARQYLNIPEEKLVLLFFGQIKKVKGVGVLLEAFAQIYKDQPNVLLIIAGSVWKDDFSVYQAIIDKFEMENSVRTDIRYIPDEEIQYYYSAADCCMLPYLDVYQSGVVQLAYAYKKPVVATNIGALKEVVLDGKSGFLCKSGDVESLACTINKVIENSDKFEEMGETGYEYVKEKYSWEKIANNINKCYLQCLK